MAPIRAAVRVIAAWVQFRARRSLPARTDDGRAACRRAWVARPARRGARWAGSARSGRRAATASRACSRRFAAARVLASVSAAVSGRPRPRPSWRSRVRRYGGGVPGTRTAARGRPGRRPVAPDDGGGRGSGARGEGALVRRGPYPPRRVRVHGHLGPAVPGQLERPLDRLARQLPPPGEEIGLPYEGGGAERVERVESLGRGDGGDRGDGCRCRREQARVRLCLASARCRTAGLPCAYRLAADAHPFGDLSPRQRLALAQTTAFGGWRQRDGGALCHRGILRAG